MQKNREAELMDRLRDNKGRYLPDEPEGHRHDRLVPHYSYCGQMRKGSACIAFHALIVWPPEHKDRIVHLIRHSRVQHKTILKADGDG